MDVSDILKSYDKDKITIGVLGGHSALDVCRGAKKLGFKTLAVCQKGRDKTYSKYYKTRDGKGIIDTVILVTAIRNNAKVWTLDKKLIKCLPANHLFPKPN